jgi:hypothetical protein
MPCTFVEEVVLHMGLRGKFSNRLIINIIIIIIMSLVTGLFFLVILLNQQ